MPSISNGITIHVNESQISPELQYVVDYIFIDRLGFQSVKLVPEGGIIYNIYVDEKQIFRVPGSGFFSELGEYIHRGRRPDVLGLGEEITLFPVMGDFDIKPDFSFDLFAATFYLLSRIEEMGDKEHDQHDRFTSEHSVLRKSSALEVPVIDVWVNHLRGILAKQDVQVEVEKFEWWNTVDLDQAYAIKGKPGFRQMGSLLKRLLKFDLDEFMTLFSTVLGKRPDPFDTLHEMTFGQARNILFILLGGNTEYDFRDSRNPDSIKKVVDAVQGFDLGLHPSYLSSQSVPVLKQELEDFRQWFNQKANFSRQHFLRMHWPETMVNLEASGVEYDFTLGFADHVGFRAGTSRPYPFFDLKSRKKTSLVLVPFSVMDVTLKNYMRLSPDLASERIGLLIKTLRKYNGLFVSLWRNSSLSNLDGWIGWKSVYKKMADQATA